MVTGMARRGRRKWGAACTLATAACFVESVPVAESSTAEEATQGAPTTGPGTTTASEDAGTTTTTTTPTTADTTGSGSSTSGPTTAPSTGSSEDSPDTTATESSTGDPPEWIAQCHAVGIVVTPDEPTTMDPWTVQFSHDVGLTNLALTVDDGTSTEYPPDGMECLGRHDFCWEFSPWVSAWPPGLLTLSVRSDEIAPMTCVMELL